MGRSRELERPGPPLLHPLPAIAFVASTPRSTSGPPTPTPEPVVRECSASDLVAVHDGINGAGGTSMWAIVFANRSDSSCGLKGRPGVRVFVNGRPAQATYVDPDRTSGHLVVLSPRQEAPVVGEALRQGQAWTYVTLSRSCSFLFATATEVALILPSDGSIVRVAIPPRDLGYLVPTPIPSERCLDAPYYPVVAAWDIAPVLPITMPADSFTALSASVNSPGLAVAGEVYRFEVTLTNTSSEEVRFGECPNYSMWASGGTDDRIVRESHVLACQTVKELAPHESATFAMELAIPADWPLTLDGGLGWIVDGYAAGVKVPLGIARRA